MRSILQRVVRRLRYGRGMSANREHAADAVKRPLAEVLNETPGCWVAVDRRTNQPRAVARTPYELAATLRSGRITGVAVVRAPDPREPELVGLG